MTIEYRQLQELEVRAEGDGRTIYGIVVPYGKEQRINANLTEVFMPGAFAQQTRAAHRIKLLVNHDLKMPIGRATLLREDPAGLYGEFRISDTNAGNEQLQLIEDGVIDHLSIGFATIKNATRPNGTIERQRAHLAEVSLVTFGAYGDAAAVSGVRDVSTTPNLDAITELMKSIRG